MMQPTYIHPLTKVGKRLLDIVVALIAIIISLPFIPFIVIAIKRDSPGPVIYQQMRIGFQNEETIKLFMMKKFRTMREDAEAGTGAVWATKNDPRITKVGNFLRKTRMDEIPQLWNVLVGDMSMVGPRPERPGMYNKLEDNIPFYAERTFDVRPGVTGLAQVNTGYDATIEDVREKVAYDHTYALALGHPWTWFKMDIQIMFKTLIVIVTGQGQ